MKPETQDHDGIKSQGGIVQMSNVLYIDMYIELVHIKIGHGMCNSKTNQKLGALY